MIDQPSQEADQEHDIIRGQRMPLSAEAQKLAMWKELVDALDNASYDLGGWSVVPEYVSIVRKARDIK